MESASRFRDRRFGCSCKADHSWRHGDLRSMIQAPSYHLCVTVTTTFSKEGHGKWGSEQWFSTWVLAEPWGISELSRLHLSAHLGHLRPTWRAIPRNKIPWVPSRYESYTQSPRASPRLYRGQGSWIPGHLMHQTAFSEHLVGETSIEDKVLGLMSFIRNLEAVYATHNSP